MLEDIKLIDSKFRLVILAAKRAKQLVRGSKKKINMHAENPLTIALKEIENGLINFEIINEADEQLALESLERIGKETRKHEEEDLLSYAGADDDDDDYEPDTDDEMDEESDEDIDDDIDDDVDDDDVDDYDDEDDDLDDVDPDDMIDDDDDD